MALQQTNSMVAKKLNSKNDQAKKIYVVIEFIRINENFQSGKDAVAGELLNHSIGRLHVMLSSFVSLKGRFPEYNLDAIEIEGETLGDTIEKLNSLLSEVAKSLEINDIVMAGDLLEYELPDVLEKFVPFLRKIKEILT